MGNVNGFVGMCVCASLSKPGYELGCKLHGCVGTCHSNTYWGVYPHYSGGCGGVCPKQTGLPNATNGCATTISAADHCTTSWKAAGTVWSCGPDAQINYSTPFHGCSPRSADRVASINPAFGDAVFHTNPFAYGHVYAQITVN